MKKALLFKFLLIIFGGTNLASQALQIDFLLFDKTTKQPIDNAHVFLVNTTYGTVSTKAGKVKLMIPQKISEDLIISHLSYETKILALNEFNQISREDTLWLAPNNFDVSQIVVTANRNNKWKKHFKKFKKVFLGKDKAADNCKILNPEVLRFEEKEGTLLATAVDLIQIQNDYLGYKINYLLTNFLVKADGSSQYAGKANYIDLSPETNKKQFDKIRLETYKDSPKFFFFSLINDQLESNGFETDMVVYEDKVFTPLHLPDSTNLITKSPSNIHNYSVRFTEFLRVINKNKKEVTLETYGVRAGGLESQKFSGAQLDNKVSFNFATSFLFKISPYIEINEFGNILNTEAVKEYGFWAEQRMAHQLPFDYGNNYQMDKKAVLSPRNKAIPTQKNTIAKTKQISDNQKLKLFTTLIYENNPSVSTQILAQVEKIWEPEFIPVLIEYLRLSSERQFVAQVVKLLVAKTGQDYGEDALSWLKWLWQSAPVYGNYYGDFKGIFHQHIDPKFKKYFYQRQPTTKIRLDEIVWGGVKQDGIPPLRQPKLLTVKEANYLNNNHIVFGVYLNGVAKAYPKRILAWHEFFTDTFGDTKIAGVYCTLCGTVIAYDMVYNDEFYDLGTSGFLYRSNKLMYDKKTQSLWNTIEGQPVLGPLANKNISLNSYAVVTTTWGEWKKLHPETKVLSLETGYNRDYSEGAAYANYFGNDKLMFPVPKLDKRLANKAEVLIIRVPNYRQYPLAISIDYLRKKKWYKGKIATTNFVVLADKTGAARAFETGEVNMVRFKKGQLIDSEKNAWKLNGNILESTNNQQLEQLPSHNIFWFAWFNNYPETRLVK